MNPFAMPWWAIEYIDSEGKPHALILACLLPEFPSHHPITLYDENSEPDTFLGPEDYVVIAGPLTVIQANCWLDEHYLNEVK